jgi:hypothetical protein
MTNQPVAQIEDRETLQLLIEHIANLEHPAGWIKHPYFDERFAQNRAGVREVKRIFCEAVVLLLEKHDRLKTATAPAARKPGRPRKDVSSD